MFMTGGVSHMDTFDPKQYLNQNHNKKTGKGNRFYKGADWAFRRHGQSGTEVSDLFPHIGGMMDDICVIRSMKNINGDHFGATIGALNVFGLVFCAFLYIKGRHFPSGPDAGSSGCGLMFDYYWGMELYPRICNVDVKKFVNCRFSMTFWQLAGVSFTAAS